MYLRNFHRYLGLILCLFLISISATGVLLLWKKEYLWLTIEDARQAVDVNNIATAIETIEASYAKDEVTFIQLYSEDLAIHKVFLSDRRYAWHNQFGSSIQIWQNNERCEDWLLDLHHRFLLGNSVGLNMAGFSGLLLMLLVAIGFVIWLPRSRSLRLGFLPKFRRRESLMISHGNIGAVFVLPILLLTVTGVILVYPAQSRWLLLDSTEIATKMVSKLNSEDQYAQPMVGRLPSWKEVIFQAYLTFPQSKIRSVRPASTKNQSRRLGVQQKDGFHRLGRSSVEIDNYGSLKVVDALKQTRNKRLLNFSYPLHAAKLGFAYKLFLSIVGSAFLLLCLLGVASFIKSNSNHR